MGGCCSTAATRRDRYLEALPRYSYIDARDAVAAAHDAPLVESVLARCRTTYPLPGTDKSYCLAHETPEQRWSSQAVLIDPELGAATVVYRVLHSHAGRVLALYAPAERGASPPKLSGEDSLGPPLAHALVRPDGESVELLVGSRSVAVVRGVSSCAAQEERSALSFAWLRPDEQGGGFTSAVKLVPDPAEAAHADQPLVVRLRLAEASGSSPTNHDEVPFAYVGDACVSTACRATGAEPRGVVPIGADRLSHARAVELCGGKHHMAMAAPVVGASTKASHRGLQAVLTVKHRRMGDAELGSLDDHLVLLLTSLAMYNSAVLWRLRTMGL